MRQLYPDLWQTEPERPIAQFPQTVCNAYLLSRESGNVLFYCTGREAVGQVDVLSDHDQLEALGGVRAVVLGHWHEASPSLLSIKDRFGSEIIVHARDAPSIERAGGVTADLTFWERQTLLDDIEAIPTPGHTVGSACYFYRSPHGKNYLFTGDTIWPARGSWSSVTFEDDPHQSAHRSSLDLLATFQPDVVFAAIGPDRSFAEIARGAWPAATAAAKTSLTR